MAIVEGCNVSGSWFGNNLAFCESKTIENMTEPYHPTEVAIYNERSLQTLVRAIALSQGQFSLILVRCNYASLQQQMFSRLEKLCRERLSLQGSQLRSLVLPTTTTTLYTTIKEELGPTQPVAVTIAGLESVVAIDEVLTSSNQVRDEFRKSFTFPLVLWVTEEVLASLIRFAPDFKSWAATSIKFEMGTNCLLDFLKQETEGLFPTVSVASASSEEYSCCSTGSSMNSNTRKELKCAIKDLESRGIPLAVDLEASLEFVFGRDDYAHDRLDSAFAHYSQSLACWQHLAAQTPTPLKNSEFATGSTQQISCASPYLERFGVLLFHLGLLYCRKARLQQAQSHENWHEARNYLQQCVEVFERGKRKDLVAKFIPVLGEVLARLRCWDELHALAEQASLLHETDPVQLARDYGFLAEVALAKGQWEETKQYAQRAIATLALAPVPVRQAQGFYLFLLAQSTAPWVISKEIASDPGISSRKAVSFKQQSQAAIAYLNLAKQATDPARDPELYISTLRLLRSLYFEQQEYLNAFRIKQEQRALETLYGFRAFIGAGSLQPQTASRTDRLNNALSQVRLTRQDSPAPPQEIAAAGRQQDVERLLERMSRADKKLTILYGYSGVGKSSLVNAGLVPALQQHPIGDRVALPAILRTYTDWLGGLSRRLIEGLDQTVVLTGSTSRDWTHLSQVLENGELSNPQLLIEQLRQNVDRNLLTVLVFDQFEEFFFVATALHKRQEFYEFLRICLDIPFVKIILSLRTDFLHYLLECEQWCKLDVINNDILSKDIRYYLGNFSKEQATEVIKGLTERSQFYLENDLIHALVNDLANDTEEVRPIELQLVGAQLQDEEEKITTLEQYQRLGDRPKDILVVRSLVQVVGDCGPENEKTAWEILYGLTNEKNTRPLKTKDELVAVCGSDRESLNLILKIMEGAGLVFSHPEESSDRYQLVHDYLVQPIRQKYETDFGPQARLVKAEEAKKLTQVELEKSNRNLKRQRGLLGLFVGLLALASIFALVQKEQASISEQNAQITAISASSEALFVSNREFDALMESLRAWRKIKQAKNPNAETKLRVVTALQQAVYGVRESNRLEGHGAEVWSVSFSPDGQLIASGGNDNQVRLWHRNGSLDKTLVDYSLLKTGLSHAREVTSVSFSPNGQLIASTSRDNTVKLWKRDGTLYQTLIGHSDSVYSADFSPDGEIVATASHDKTIKLWRVADGSLVKTITGHRDSVNWVTFSPDGKLLASASDDKTVKLWKKDGSPIRTLPPHKDWVTVVAFSPDGRHIVSAGVDTTIRVSDIDGTAIESWKAHDGGVFSLSFSPDGQWFASASDDNTIELWKLDGTLIKSLKGHSGRVTSVSFNPDINEMTLASASFDKTVRLWSLKDTFLKILTGEVGHSERVSSVSFSRNGKQVASSSWDKTVKIWTLDENGDAERVTTLSGANGHTSRVFSVSFSPNGELIASASQDCTVKIWSRDGRLLKTLVDPGLDAGVAQDGDCKSPRSHSDRVYAVSFSPDGELIASGSRDKTVKLWRLDGSLVAVLEGHLARVNSVSFSPNGQIVASGSDDKTIKLWSVDGKLQRTLAGVHSHQSYVTSVSFSPKDNLIASASWDNTVKIWNIDGTLQKTLLQGYSDSVESVSFSPDGRTLASASWDNTVKLWSLKDGTLLKTLQGHTSGVLDVAFSPDGKTIASAGDDKTVILWNLDIEDLTRRACIWLHDYLNNNPNISAEDRTLCEEIIGNPPSKKD